MINKELIDLACREFNPSSFSGHFKLMISDFKIKDAINLVEVVYEYMNCNVTVVTYIPLEFYYEYSRNHKINQILL